MRFNTDAFMYALAAYFGFVVFVFYFDRFIGWLDWRARSAVDSRADTLSAILAHFSASAVLISATRTLAW